MTPELNERQGLCVVAFDSSNVHDGTPVSFTCTSDLTNRARSGPRCGGNCLRLERRGFACAVPSFLLLALVLWLRRRSGEHDGKGA
jgi:hypothetical protein